MKEKEFIETLSDVLKESAVDKNSGIIRQVCIMRSESRNNRVYQPQAIASVKRLAEGIKSFLDHDNGTSGPSVMQLIGSFKNVQERNGKLFGDLHILRESKGRELILDIAENAPHLAGFSIAGSGKFADSQDEQGRDVVEDVISLRSVDFVGTPATTNGVFESKSIEEIERQQSKQELLDCIRYPHLKMIFYKNLLSINK